MSAFDILPDAPGLLRAESLNTTIKLDRTSDTTARISWNIPTPAAGCAAGTQAYCGMLVTVDTKPVSLATVPTNGQIYSSDPTVTPGLHVGDTVGTALVVGAFYNDRETTFLDITGLRANTAYYVSGFPTDCQYQYFREGIHAYSTEFKSNGSEGSASTQVVLFNYQTDPTGVDLAQDTGLNQITNPFSYNFNISLGVKPTFNRPTDPQECLPTAPVYPISIDRTLATTYEDLLNEINHQLALLTNPTFGPTAPDTGTYVVTGTPAKAYLWNGTDHVEQTTIRQTDDPAVLQLTDYWFNPVNLDLSKWNGTNWTATAYTTYASDPTAPVCNDTVWLNGVNGYVWNGTTWITTPVIVASTDPSIVNIECGSYWFSTATNYLYGWNENAMAWVSVDAVQSITDPLALPVNSYWYDETASTLKVFDGVNVWTVVPTVSYSEHAPTAPGAGTIWYNPTANELNIRNPGNTGWISTPVIAYPTNPTVVTSGSLWWDEDATPTSKLYVYNVTSSAWVEVTKFYEQDLSPSLPPTISQGALWIDSESDLVYRWENNCFVLFDPIRSTYDPTTPPLNTVWYNPTLQVFHIRNSSNAWDLMSVTITTNDPSALPNGTLWLNPVSRVLQSWNGVTWVAISPVRTTFVKPVVGLQWYDTSSGVLKEWNGVSYILATPLAQVEQNCNGHFVFTHNVKGSMSFVRVTDGETDPLFASLNVPFSILLTNPGSDGVSDLSSYEEEGIGTDGSVDERRKLANDIRYALGYPVIDVELTPEQIDLATTMAISEYRSHSSAAYKRSFFFMRTIGEEQRYLLTNKITGMHKIVSVLGVTRMTSSFLSAAHGAGVYGQVILQQLYNMGNFDILSYHLQAEYVKTLEIMFAGRITFNWDEHKRELFIHTRLPFSERVVLIEAMVERTEQDLINDRWSKEWIRRFATAKSKEMLAQIRGKYSTLPGAGGSVSLNSSDLAMQAAEEIRMCYQEIEDYIADRPEDLGYTSSFVFG